MSDHRHANQSPGVEFAAYCASRWEQAACGVMFPRKRKPPPRWHEPDLERWDWNNGMPIEEGYGL